MAECSLQESCCLDGCPLFCIRDVHLTDGGMCTDFSQMRSNQVEEEALFACDEESVLQMSELGLPTCFATRSNGKGYRQQRKSKKSSRRKSHASLDDDQAITSLDGGFSEGLCITVNESSVLRSVQLPSVGRGQVSKERAIVALVLNEFADEGARVSNGEAIYHQEVVDKGARAYTGESSEQLKGFGFTNHPSVERSSVSNDEASISQMVANEEAGVSSFGAMPATKQGGRVLLDGAVTAAPDEGGRVSIGAAKKGAMVSNGGVMVADEGAWVSSGGAINTQEGARVSSGGAMAACEGYRVSNNEAMPTDEGSTVSNGRVVAADEEAMPLNGSTCKADKGARFSKQETMAADAGSGVSNYEGIGADEGVRVSNHKSLAADEGARISAHEEMVEGARISSQEMQAEEASFLDPEVTVLLPWMPCWDDYYSRYYFYNRETYESTWEPPEGFERYAYASAVENSTALQEGAEYYSGGNLNDGQNLVSTTIVVKETIGGGESVDDDCKLDGFIHVALGLDAVPGSKETLGNGEHLDCSQGKLDDGNYIESGYILQKQAAVEGNGACEESTQRKSDSFDIVVCVKAATCKDPVPKRRIKKASSFLSRLDCQLTDIDRAMIDHNPSVFKYWIQRFHLFSKFNAGVKLDEEGWFSVTPEAIARHQAARCNHGVVVDAFTGVGGNAIQFALAGHYVVAIDNDPRKIEYAHHNALVYGVADLIDFIVGDFFAVSSSLQADVVFLSPPWGGPEYVDFKLYDIQTMLQPRDGISLFKVAQAVAPNIVFFLPRNVNMSQLVELSKASKPPCSCEVERNFLNGKLKAVTAYFGEFACVEATI